MESAIYGKNQQKLFGIKKLIENILLKNHFLILEIFLALHILMTSGIKRTVLYSLLVFGV
jgi:hypothetical protein